MPSLGKGVKDTPWVTPTALERSMGDRERGWRLGTDSEKPAVNQVQPELGQSAWAVPSRECLCLRKWHLTLLGAKAWVDTLRWT